MAFTELQLIPVRAHARLLVEAYVPSDTGEPRFEHIAKDYGGKGTTCGFLCHWLLWRLGSDNTRIINRSETGFTYVDGQNISRIFNGGKPPFRLVLGGPSMQRGLRPKPGDVVFIKQHPNGAHTTEHVFVFLEEFPVGPRTFWRTAEAGQKNSSGRECARPGQRELLLGKSTGARVTGNTPQREIFGWISLAELSYNFMPPFPPIPPPPLDPILLNPF